MSDDMNVEVVETIIADVVEQMPKGTLRFYRDLPGMRPSEHSRMIRDILIKLNDDEVISIIADITDRAVFSLLHLFDLSFKDRHIQVSFTRQQDPDSAPFGSLLDTYRERVDPGGNIVG